MNEDVYVAGPFGFTEPGKRYLYDEFLPALRAAGLTPLDPWEVGDRVLGAVLRRAGHTDQQVVDACSELGAANEELIRKAAGVIALVDGCDLDSGTCSEIGFAVALGKRVVGLRTDTRSAGDVREIPINLQVKHFIESSGGVIETALPDAIAALIRCLRK
jgi:nucleoside 2-deoxyribosyltransferase